MIQFAKFELVVESLSLYALTVKVTVPLIPFVKIASAKVFFELAVRVVVFVSRSGPWMFTLPKVHVLHEVVDVP